MAPPNPDTDGGSSYSARPPAIGLGSALAARAIEKELRTQLGESAFSSLMTLIDTLGQGEQQRMQTYIRGSTRSH
jgi:hypothetical protein